ncbi:MAG: hypothetical protein U5L96_19440 [Owenweeksia sp.]|nr:hypothetical protein [Owenweeksia sp.]
MDGRSSMAAGQNKGMAYRQHAPGDPRYRAYFFQKCLYSNRKIKQQLGYEFKPVAESIKDIAKMYLQE